MPGDERPGVTASDGSVRITLDLLLDGDGRPNGSVWVGEAAPHPVLGWLELMSELTRLLSNHGPDGSVP